MDGNTGALNELDDDGLKDTIAAQRELVTACERVLAQARDQFDRERRRLRELEGEHERRRLAAAGLAPSPVEDKRARRKRRTTCIDALMGRDGIEQDWLLAQFRLYSLQHQEVLLNHTGERTQQSMGFLHPTSGEWHEAQTFSEGHRIQDLGFQPGWPGVPLQRQPVWYVAESRPGWLRLDQIFVEQGAEEE